jgi:hypothetical protein
MVKMAHNLLSKAKQSKAKQSKAKQSKAKQSKAKQSKVDNCALFASCGCEAFETEYYIRDG